MQKFELTFNYICAYLNKNIKNNNFTVKEFEDQTFITLAIVNAFVLMDPDNNFGTDGNVTPQNQIITDVNSYYFIVVKRNSKLKNEAYYLFYNDSPKFNPMKLYYVGCFDEELQKTPNNLDIKDLIKTLNLPIGKEIT